MIFIGFSTDYDYWFPPTEFCEHVVHGVDVPTVLMEHSVDPH
jgi:hypothetical protein